MKIDLLFACDEHYAPYAGVVLRSVWRTREKKEKFRVWFISDGISQSTQQWLRKQFSQMEVSFLSLPAGFMKNAPIRNRHLSRAAYARLAMGSVLPAFVKRVIYLDCDLLVRRSLGELWRFDLKGKILAGVEDWGVYLWRKQGLFSFPQEEAYIGSGLLLVDVEKWRAQNCEARCLTYLAEPKREIRFEDQDILNFALCGNFARISPAWDVVLHFSERDLIAKQAPGEWLRALKNPYVIHFATANKPWRDICSLPYVDEFQAHMRRLGLPVMRSPWRMKTAWLVAYWWKRPVFFLKPSFWKKWRQKKWSVFI